MVSRMPRLEAASIAQSTIAPAGWFTERRMARSAGGTTAPNLPRGSGGANKGAGIGQRADDVQASCGVEWRGGRWGAHRAVHARGEAGVVGARAQVRPPSALHLFARGPGISRTRSRRPAP